MLAEAGTCWAIRLTDPELDLEKTFKLFSYAARYIVSEEGDGDSTKLHQHILLYTEETGDQIRERIREVYPILKGNKSVYIKPSRDKRQLAKYTVKEGQYKYKGFTPEYISETFKCSRAKTDLKKDISLLEEQFILHHIDSEEFLDRYVQLKVKHDQSLYTSHLTAYMRKMMVRNGTLSSKTYSESIIYQIRQN